MMSCCGRCQLRKRLAQENNQDKNNPERRAENKDVLFMEGNLQTQTVPLLAYIKLPYLLYLTQRPIDQAVGIFHPPV